MKFWIAAFLCFSLPALAYADMCVDDKGAYAPEWSRLKNEPSNFICKVDADCVSILAGCGQVAVNKEHKKKMEEAASCLNQSVDCTEPEKDVIETPLCIKKRCEMHKRKATAKDFEIPALIEKPVESLHE